MSGVGDVVVSTLASGTIGDVVVSTLASGTFGDVVVSTLASGTQDCGFAPGQNCQIFRAKKVLSMPSFRREIKPFAPCRRFAACQRTL
jgi:hypothetical protein